ERHASRARRAPDLLDRLERADLAVGRHHRDQRGVVAERSGHRVWIEAAPAIYGHRADAPALFLQLAAGVPARGVPDRPGGEGTGAVMGRLLASVALAVKITPPAAPLTRRATFARAPSSEARASSPCE